MICCPGVAGSKSIVEVTTFPSESVSFDWIDVKTTGVSSFVVVELSFAVGPHKGGKAMLNEALETDVQVLAFVVVTV